MRVLEAVDRARVLWADPAHLAATVGVAFACAYAFVSLWLPFGWDHAILASVGDAVARGGLPFRDAWDMKGPIAYVPFAVAQLLFGKTMWGVRLMDIAIALPALAVFHRALAAHSTNLLAIAGGVALYLWLAADGWFFSAQPEVWVAMLTAAAAGLVLSGESSGRPSAVSMAVCGALIACAGLIKFLYLGFGLVPLAYLAVETRLSLTRRIVLAAWLAAGAAAPILATLGYIIARGGLEAMIEVQVTYTLGSYGGVGGDMNLGPRALVLGIFNYVVQTPMAAALPFALVGLWALRTKIRVLAPMVAWLLVAALAVAVQAKLWEYQWFPLFPPVVACAALGLHALLAEGRGITATRVFAAAVGLLFAVQVAAAPAREILWWARSLVGLVGDGYYARFQFQTYNAGDEIAAAAYIRERTTADEGVYIWGIDATVSYLSRRPNPSRFTFSMPLSIEGDLRAAYREELLADLAAAPPTYIVMGSPWRTWRGKDVEIAEFPELQALLRDDYALETSIGYVDLYRRTGS